MGRSHIKESHKMEVKIISVLVYSMSQVRVDGGLVTFEWLKEMKMLRSSKVKLNDFVSDFNVIR